MSHPVPATLCRTGPFGLVAYLLNAFALSFARSRHIAGSTITSAPPTPQPIAV